METTPLKTVLTIGAPGLRLKSEPVDVSRGGFQKRAAEMFEILAREQGVGLAAPQIGVMERFFVVKLETEEGRVFINPSILETSREICPYDEGCLSVPGVWAQVVRPQRVRVQAWNETGRPFTIEASGLLARVIQHEYDHLEGILFVDRLSEYKRERLLEKYERLNAKDAKKDSL